MKNELHEEILLYLYERRNEDEFVDILPRFKEFSANLLYEKAGELENKKLIRANYPFSGIGALDWNTGEMTWHGAEKENYIKAKITTEGIEVVRKINSKKDWLEKSYKITAILGVVGTISLGVITYVTDRKVENLEQDKKGLSEKNIRLEKRIELVVDSLQDVHDKTLMEQENIINHQVLRIDSLTLLSRTIGNQASNPHQ